MSFLTQANRQVSSNALIKFASEVIGRVATFILVLWAAQRLGEAGFGLYNYGLALGFVLAQLADLGLQILISREIAVIDVKARPLVLSALRLKLLFSLAVILLLVLLTGGWSGELRLSLIFLGLMPLAQTYLEFVAYVFRGQQKLLVEARILAVARLLTAVIGGAVLGLGGGLLALSLSSAISTGLLVIWSLHLLQQAGWLDNFGHIVRAHASDGTSPGLYRHLLRQSLPIGISIFISIAYTRLAILILQYRLGEVAVGHFSAAYRLVEPSQIVPASLLAAAFPAFTYALHNDPPQARQLGIQVSLLLALTGGGIAVVFWLASAWLIPLLYGNNFASSIAVLQVLGLSTMPAFINYSLTHYLIARGQQLFIGIFTAVMLVLHAVLSWQLIPVLGPVGPAISIILAEIVLLVCCLLILALTQSKTALNL